MVPLLVIVVPAVVSVVRMPAELVPLTLIVPVLINVLFVPRASRPKPRLPVVVTMPALVSVLAFPVEEMPNALRPDVMIWPWLRTVLLLTTPIARAVDFMMEPDSTVTLTSVLLAAAVTTVDAAVGFGAAVSQTTVWLDV